MHTLQAQTICGLSSFHIKEKADLAENRKVTTENAIRFYKALNDNACEYIMDYVETSAKTGENIQIVMEQAIRECILPLRKPFYG